MTIIKSKRRFGALESGQDSILWRVWAPNAKRVELVLHNGADKTLHTMTLGPENVFETHLFDIPEGQQYSYRLDGGDDRPDPCSLHQPGTVHGPSAVLRTSRFSWNDGGFRPVTRKNLVLYELHVGTFTAEGTFTAAIQRLPELAELGITAIEIMPVAQFPGSRNWGYDGVLPYAAQNTYGGAEGLHKLVDECHALGMSVFLDVVYNHMGPEGNYLSQFGPYFTESYKTPWGSAINYDGPGSDTVRDFVLDNVRMWLVEFHIDGLRLDAVHAIYDFGARHILRAIKETAEQVARETGKEKIIIAESDQNDPRTFEPRDRGGHALDGQWADDFHHAVHTLLTGESNGYYSDFGAPRHLADAFRTPFVYAGKYSPHRGRKHGAPPRPATEASTFVVCIQNHDQVGNRAKGDRLSSLFDSYARNRLAAALLCLSGYTPLLFMGEEYGETKPFLYFCSFDDKDLIEAVRKGRKEEFRAFSWDDTPDPQSEETFAASKLSWDWKGHAEREGLRLLYKELLGKRKDWVGNASLEERASVLWPHDTEGPILELSFPGDQARPKVLFNISGGRQRTESRLRGEFEILFASEDRRYGGSRGDNQPELLPYECLVINDRPSAKSHQEGDKR